AAHLGGALPLAVAAAKYRTRDGAEIVVAIGDYGTRMPSWISWRSILETVKPWDAGALTAAGVDGRRLDAGAYQGLVFRRGQFVVAIRGERGTDTAAMLEALASAAQL
ncbi:MAG TPA: hypothetical protein VEA16_01595, partial [Vicinamibacterales bacterium]|nr:hypothetical protein [Vicinamibacterales bacterium]